MCNGRITLYSHIILILVASVSVQGAVKNCFLQTADAALKACSQFLETLEESDFPNCAKDLGPSCQTNDTSAFCPSNCAELQAQGIKQSGIYTICFKPWFRLPPTRVFCDLETKGGGWTVLQRRGDFNEPSDSFYRNWTDYKLGFGNLSTQFWIGNEQIFALTNQDRMTLRVELEDFDNKHRWAEYDDFRVGSEDTSFTMTDLGNYSGNAGDSLSFHKDMAFYTRDRDNWMKCARDRRGGWWYFNCHRANLNGLYVGSDRQPSSNGNPGRLVSWGTFRGFDYSLKATEMKIRPSFF